MSEALLQLSGINKSFKDAGTLVQVLRSLDCVVQAGDFMAVRGVSGSGKSTFLHLAGLLDKPTSGQVFFEGRDITQFSDKQLSRIRNTEVGFVFQFHHLMPDFTALENVMMPKWIQGKEQPSDKEYALELLEKVGMSHRLQHLPSEMSGGERQRVAMARALIQKPKLLLADEPSGNLDEENKEALHQLLKELHSDLKVTIMLVTHEVALFDIAESRFTLHNGVLQRE